MGRIFRLTSRGLFARVFANQARLSIIGNRGDGVVRGPRGGMGYKRR